jgi:dinuclear metal center YbgI/SA1388 family protein
MTNKELESYLADYLKIADFNDICPNGLQVEGKEEILRVITGVSASVELFKKAISDKADVILVHHGVIWSFERPVYRGGYRERIRLLLEKNINLFAYHLPLDAHPESGNNAQICKSLNIHDTQPFGDYKGQYIGVRGYVKPTVKDSFFKMVENVVGQKAMVFDYGPDIIREVGVVSGGAQKEIKQAVAAGLDTFITGEVSEHIMHYAKEEKIHFIAAGHYATEKFGVIALGKHLMEKFSLKIKFIDIPNPV